MIRRYRFSSLSLPCPRGAASCLELLDKRDMLWRLDPALQRSHDRAAIALEQGWGIEPEPRKYCRLKHPTRISLRFPICAVLQDKPALYALAQDDHHIF